MKTLKEPLLHFLLLAVLLFALEAVFSSVQKEQVIVDQQTADYLIKQREDLELRQLSPEERNDTIDAYVEDEILYSEAYKRGLDKGDSRMRRNLILKMRGLLVGDLRQPSEDELRSYFESNRDEFTQPATLSLDHVYFSDAAGIPGDLLDQLRSGTDPNGLGDSRLDFSPSLKRLSQRQLVGMFGPEAARQIMAINDSQWYGPIESSRGIHFLRISNRTPPIPAEFDQVKGYLEGRWSLAESRQLIEQELQRLRDDYEIVIDADLGAMQ
mgnify:CR=1 FL=1